MTETPTLEKYATANSSYTMASPEVWETPVLSGSPAPTGSWADLEEAVGRARKRNIQRPRAFAPEGIAQEMVVNNGELEVAEPTRRLVRVLIVDPTDQLKVEDALLYDSKELFTDKTDQELFFDVPMTELLLAHNEARTKTIDKTIKDRTEYLEAIRIRDLKMVVVDIAKF